MVCVSVYSTLLTLNVRAFTLINLNFSIYFSIKSFFFYIYILQDHFTKHPHILPFILFKYTHTHTYIYIYIYSFLKYFISSLSHTFSFVSVQVSLLTPLTLLLSPLRSVPSHVLLSTIRSLFSILSIFNFLYPLRSLLS